MKGHFQTNGLRRMNRHYQSAGIYKKPAPPSYELVATGERYYIIGDYNNDVYIDSNNSGGEAKYLRYDNGEYITYTTIKDDGIYKLRWKATPSYLQLRGSALFGKYQGYYTYAYALANNYEPTYDMNRWEYGIWYGLVNAPKLTGTEIQGQQLFPIGGSNSYPKVYTMTNLTVPAIDIFDSVEQNPDSPWYGLATDDAYCTQNNIVCWLKQGNNLVEQNGIFMQVHFDFDDEEPLLGSKTGHIVLLNHTNNDGQQTDIKTPFEFTYTDNGGGDIEIDNGIFTPEFTTSRKKAIDQQWYQQHHEIKVTDMDWSSYGSVWFERYEWRRL